MIRITGIVTDLVKHTDRHNVVTLFTRERGRMSFITHGGSGKRGASRAAQMMPLSMLTADIRIDATRDLQILNNSTREEIWRDIYFNPVKSSIAIFIAEFLNSYLRFSETDPQLWDYVADSIRTLDEMKRGSANLHLGFLIGLLHYAGISPDLTEARIHPEKEKWFDMREGSTTYMPPLHRDYIEPDKIGALCTLMRMTPQNCKAYRLNGKERREILDALLRYYSIHFPGIGNLKSPAVLREIFS